MFPPETPNRGRPPTDQEHERDSQAGDARLHWRNGFVVGLLTCALVAGLVYTIVQQQNSPF